MRVEILKGRKKLTRVVNAVDDGSVDLDEEDSGILESDFDRLDQCIKEDGRHLHVALVNLALGHEALVSSNLADALSTTKENCGCASLREEEKHGNENGSRSPDRFVERPSPALDGDSEATQQRTKGSYSN